ncbi:hydroxypyruvate isomerase family protein [Membranihabitans marinus]|uniref:hydroxypyruvate isomerase family protein n=1 Tax=Membranihabitans marinus TaxID=1227546 RepID=UPI001F26DDE5|nr:TIM barrel protein [Membranihabitans marinus]
MNRRKFVKNSVLTASALSIGSQMAEAAEKKEIKGETFNLNYAPHQGMFKNHAGDNFIDQIKYMADLGFRSIEDNGMMKRSVDEQEKIGNTLASLGMDMGVFVIDKGGNGANTFAAGKEEYNEIFLKSCHKAVEVAKRTNAKWMTVVPGNFERRLPLDIQTGNVIETLRRGAEIFEPHGLVMVLEPLSDSPDLFLRTSVQTHMICKAVDSPSCKILYDAYHLQKNEGNLITNMKYCWDEIDYIQIGDNPGRKEPYTGEINYKNVFKFLYEQGFKGIVGMEHGLSEGGKEGENKLVAAYRKADDFL